MKKILFLLATLALIYSLKVNAQGTDYFDFRMVKDSVIMDSARDLFLYHEIAGYTDNGDTTIDMHTYYTNDTTFYFCVRYSDGKLNEIISQDGKTGFIIEFDNKGRIKHFENRSGGQANFVNIDMKDDQISKIIFTANTIKHDKNNYTVKVTSDTINNHNEYYPDTLIDNTVEFIYEFYQDCIELKFNNNGISERKKVKIPR